MQQTARPRRARLIITGAALTLSVLLAGALVPAAAVAATTSVEHTSTALPDFPDSSAAASGCQTVSERYPWGKSALREWTPVSAELSAPGNGKPFEARLIQAYNRDTGNSNEIGVLEDARGCRTAYPMNAFRTADRDYVNATRAQNPPPADPATYRTVYDPNLVTEEQVLSGTVLAHETQHFSILYGTDTDAFSYQWQADRNIDWEDGIETFGRWMEESYEMIRDVTGAPMPWADVDDKRRINIYLCGTGLPWFDDTGDCGASASGTGIWVSAVYILDGSSTMTHELAHVLQGQTGGFAGGWPGAGNAWEGHANWVSASTGSYFNIWYYQNLENGPTWQTNYYGFFPILLQLAENDATRQYLWRAWQENLRDANGQTQEELLQTIVRLGREDGVYPLGFASFADDLGWYGARLAANDFVQGRTFRDTIAYNQEASRYVGLVPTDDVNVFASPPDRSLWQFGSHLIPLEIDGDTVSVSVAGEAQKDTAAWRYSLVHIGVDGSPRYSALGADDAPREGTTVTLDAVEPGQYFLAVTATPYDLEPIGNDEKPVNASEYPYTVHLDGARPELPGTGTCLGPFTAPDAANLNWKTNGNFAWDQACTDIGPRVLIDEGPADTTVAANQSAIFTASASGLEAPTLQWQSAAPGATSWADIDDANGQSLVLPPGQQDGLHVRLVAIGKAGTKVASHAATLSVTTVDPELTPGKPELVPPSTPALTGTVPTNTSNASPAPTRLANTGLESDLSLIAAAVATLLIGALLTARTRASEVNSRRIERD